MEAAFAAQFDRLWTVGYQVAFKILGDREEAADVSQEALTKAALRWDRVGEYAEAFIARVAGQRAIDLRRRRSHRDSLDPGRSDRPVAVEDRDELVAALRHLPKRQREVVVLRYLGDISEADTAMTLGCTTGAVKQHAARGLAALRVLLASPTEGV